MTRQLTKRFAPNFEKMFNPKSIAFIGASASSMDGDSGFLPRYRELGFQGRMYPVNPNASEILGLKCYPTIGSVPETVDFAVITVPRRFVPQILTECADAGVDTIHIFTAGFKETGEPEGIELENRIKEIAESRGLAIMGPNGMGPYVPKARIGTYPNGPTESGPVGLICQSGTIAGNSAYLGWELGIRFSKILSFGNGTVLDSTDFLEYMSDDPETKIIAMYLEGIGDGRKLTRLVREINPVKPVIILKGGLTESGARAVASHTGSLAGSEAIWNAFFKQTGAVRVDTPEEMMDAVAAFHYMLPLRSRRMALIGMGGGMSVTSADACATEGIVAPPFSDETFRSLKEYVPIVGGSIRNPLDTSFVFTTTALLQKTLDIVASDPAIDGILIHLLIDMMRLASSSGGDLAAENYKYIGDFAKNNLYKKPVAALVHTRYRGVDMETQKLRHQSMLIEASVPVFPTFGRAAKALRRFADYHEFIGGQN